MSNGCTHLSDCWDKEPDNVSAVQSKVLPNPPDRGVAGSCQRTDMVQVPEHFLRQFLSNCVFVHEPGFAWAFRRSSPLALALAFAPSGVHHCGEERGGQSLSALRAQHLGCPLERLSELGIREHPINCSREPISRSLHTTPHTLHNNSRRGLGLPSSGQCGPCRWARPPSQSQSPPE